MKRINLNKKSYLIIILVAVIAIGVFIHLNPHISLSFIRLFNSDYDTNSVTYEKADYYGFGKADNKIVAAYADSIKLYNDKLEETHSITSSGSNPTVKTGGENIVVYYPSEKKAIVKNDNIEKMINTDYYILNAAVNEKGYFALITEEKGFKSQVLVYDSDGKEIYKWHSADYYIVDVDIADNSKSMVLNAITSSEIGMTSKIMMFNFTDSEPFCEMECNDTAVLDVKFVAKKRVAVIGNTKMRIYTTDGFIVREEDYSTKQLFTYNLSDDNIIIATGDTASATEEVMVKIYSSSGKLRGEYTHGGEILGIDLTSGGVLVYGKRNLALISNGGRVKRDLDLNVDILKAYMFNDEKTVFVVSNSVAKIYYLR